MTQAAWRRGATDALFWSLLYTALWALFAAGQGWVLGVPTITLAVALSLWLGLRPMTLRLASLPAFLGFFLKHMLLGGWDVARRALQPRCPLQPAWHPYPLTSQSPRVRLLLSAMVGLLPGTLASRVDADEMRVHVVTADALSAFGDPDRLLTNVNTPAEYAGLDALQSHKQ